MIKLGITGGIGSGKSYVSQLLVKRGLPVFDCDSQAKRLTVEHPGIRSGLVALLGPSVYTEEGLNKPVLAAYLFASKENAARVNAIIHPCVKEAFREWAIAKVAEGNEIVAMESAILYESGFDDAVDRVLMVHAPLEVRCERVMVRDGISRAEVEKRIHAQLSDEEKCRRADYVIENDGTLPLEGQLDKLFSQLEGVKLNK